MVFGVESSAVVVGAVSSAVVLDMTIWFLSWRSNRKRIKRLEFEMEEMRFEIRKLREEMKHLHASEIIEANNCVPKISLTQLTSFQKSTTSSESPSSISDYVDAVEEWSSGHSIDHSDETPLLVITKNTTSLQFDKIDELHEQTEGEKCYAILKKAYDSDADSKQNVELLWRLARACHLQASSMQQKNPKKKELLLEGQKYAQAAYKINSNNFNVLKWCAVLTGTLTDFLGTKEKIQQGYQFKEYLDKAIGIKTEYSLLHMRGRFSYSVATLSWLERKAASAFFATPPTATIDDALHDFLEVEKVRPNVWIENLLYCARCYIIKNDKVNTVKYLKQASQIEAQDEADSEALEEVKQLLVKHNK